MLPLLLFRQKVAMSSNVMYNNLVLVYSVVSAEHSFHWFQGERYLLETRPHLINIYSSTKYTDPLLCSSTKLE